MKKLLLITATAAAVFASAITSHAQVSPWTSPCSAGATIDEGSRNLYATFSNYLTFRTGQVGTVQARYDVVNASASTNPPWGFIQLDCIDSLPGDSVSATLFQYTPCIAELKTICTITSNDSGEQCPVCQFDPATFVFINNVYWVTVNITRNNANDNVRANAVRIFQ
jgi:hypothetical protein